MAGILDFYAGCTALITGASAGLGQEFARRLAPVARYLLLIARRGDRLETLRAELETAHPTVRVVIRPCDLSDPAETASLVKWLADESFQIDLLINNAGLGDHGRFATADTSRVDQMLQVNIGALTQLTRALLPGMLQRRVGAICNISSIAALFPVPNLAVYAATKSYVSNFSESLRAELRGTGVSVTTICPGPVDTEFSLVARRHDGPGLPAPECAKTSIQQVVAESLHAIAHDQPRRIPNLLLAIAVLAIAAVPLLLKRPVLARMAQRIP